MLKLSDRSAATALAVAIVLLAGAALVPAAATVHGGQDPVTAGTPAAPSTPVPLRSGPVLFHESGCEHCHGANFAGTAKGPSLLTVGKRLKKEAVEHQIHDGGGEMPAFADALQPDEIQQLVQFLATKKKAPKGVVPYVAPPVAGPSTPSSPDQ